MYVNLYQLFLNIILFSHRGQMGNKEIKNIIHKKYLFLTRQTNYIPTLITYEKGIENRNFRKRLRLEGARNQNAFLRPIQLAFQCGNEQVSVERVSLTAVILKSCGHRNMSCYIMVYE